MNEKMVRGYKLFILFCFLAQYNLNAQTWDSVGTGITGSSTVNTMIEYNGRLYAAGAFTSTGGVQAKKIARWNGSSWDSVGGGLSSDVYALAVYNGELYAGGQFLMAGGNTVHYIAK